MAERLRVWLEGGESRELELGFTSAPDWQEQITSDGAPGKWLPATDGSLVRVSAIVALRVVGGLDEPAEVEPSASRLSELFHDA